MGASDGVTGSRHLVESGGSRVLLAWMRKLRRAPDLTFVVHGEPDAADTLRAEIKTRLGWEVRVPEFGQTVQI